MYPGYRQIAQETGERIANKVFAKHKNAKIEVHMQRAELTAMLAVAFELGVEHTKEHGVYIRSEPDSRTPQEIRQMRALVKAAADLGSNKP